MERLLIVDGNNLLFQMFYGMPSKIYNKSSKIPVSLRKQCKNKNNYDNLLESKDHTLLSGNSNLLDLEFERTVLNFYFKVK